MQMKNFELVYARALTLLCFRMKGTNEQNRELLKIINESGKVLLTQSVIKGVMFLRFAIGSPQTTEQHVNDAWEFIVEISSKLVK